MSLQSQDGSSGAIGSHRKRRYKVEVDDERESNMIDVCNYKVYSGPFTTEERDYLLQLGYLQLGQDGEYHEIETESDSDEDDHHDAIAKELKKSEQLLRSFAHVDGSEHARQAPVKGKDVDPIGLNSDQNGEIQDGGGRESFDSFSPVDQRSSGKKIEFSGLKKKTRILMRAIRKKYRR